MPSSDFLDAVHPLLTEPTLYLADVPAHITWVDIEPLFKKCGTVTTDGWSNSANSNRIFWTLQFQNIFYAEMALATLQNLPMPNSKPPYNLRLSHSPSLAFPAPLRRLYPQYVKTKKTVEHPLLLCTAQKVFQWFRHAGPLVSVRVNVDIGFAQTTCVLEYWEEEHARYALTYCQTLHSSLKAFPPFVLRIFNPTSLLCSNLGAAIHENDIQGRFKKFGKIINIRVVHPNTIHCHAYIIYNTRHEAASAMREMKDKMFGSNKIYVRFFEPAIQDIFQDGQPRDKPGSSYAGRKTHNPSGQEKTKAQDAWSEPGKQYGPAPQPKAKPESEQSTQERTDELNRLRADARRLRAEASAVTERNAAKRMAAMLATQAAQEAEEEARARRAAEEASEAKAGEAAADLQDSREKMEERVSEADTMVAEAERMLREAKLLRDRLVQELDDLKRKHNSVQQREAECTRQRREALLSEAALQAKRERLERDEQRIKQETRGEDEEVCRRADLAESIVKMKELSCNEETTQTGQGDGGPRDDAQGWTADAEDVGGEGRRQHNYKAASAKERARCKQRDMLPWSQRVSWGSKHAIQRFKNVSLEFDEIRFNDGQPLTFESVPWPNLGDPNKLAPKDIDWSSVEAFFSEVRALAEASEYKELVVKTHRRFHPDKWRARGLLSTVLDDDLRSKLEAAGLVVSQSLTPLWRECK